MRALVYEGPKEMKLREVADPVPAADEVLIRVAYSGICGSELSGYLGHNSLRKPPLIFGHEFAGTVEAVGSSATGGATGSATGGFRPGQRVTANPLITCGQCVACKSGRQQLCSSRKLLSAALPGSNAELVAVPAAFVYELPETMTLQQGALVEPAACAMRAAELSRVKPGDTVLVMGMGPIGLLTAQALKLHGASRVIAVDMNVGRLELAKSLGADETIPALAGDTVARVLELNDGKGVQAAVDAVGAARTRAQCVQAVMPGGNVVFTGLHEDETTLPINTIIRNEIAMYGAFAYSAVNFESALRELAAGRLKLGDAIVEAPLAEGASWFEMLIGSANRVSKVLLKPQQ